MLKWIEEKTGDADLDTGEKESAEAKAKAGSEEINTTNNCSSGEVYQRIISIDVTNREFPPY